MTSQRTLSMKPRILTAVTLFIAALTVLIAFAASAQQADTAKSSAQSPAASVLSQTNTPVPALPSGVGNSKGASAERFRDKKPGSAVPDSGNPLFLPAVLYTVTPGGPTDPSGPTSIAIADVNGDGKPDVIASNWGGVGKNPDGSANVWLGNGDGTFQPVVAYDSGGNVAMSVAVADLNADGKPDIVLVNAGFPFGSGSVAVLLGNGNGTFQPAVLYDVQPSSGPRPGFIAIADMNGDGKPDLIVAGPGIGSDGFVTVLLGNGDGTFQPATNYYDSGGVQPVSLAVADLNGDGKLDVIVANCCFGNVIGVLMGNGNGTLQPAVTYPTGGLANSVAIADVNGDGKPDVLLANMCATATGECETTEGSAAVLLGNGDGTFQTAVVYDSGGIGGSSVAVADVNGDGKLDLLVANRCASICVSYPNGDGTVGILLGNGHGTFEAAIPFGSGGPNYFGPPDVLVADVNGDGRPDVVVSASGTGVGDGGAGVLLNNTGPHALTTTTLASNLNPVVTNQSVIYTATVTSQSGEALTGSVMFQDGGTTVGTSALSGNQAVYSARYDCAELSPHVITASYSGDFHNSVSTSPALTEHVEAASNTALSTSASPSFVGQPVTFTTSVTSICGTIPNGELVTFYDRGSATVIGTATTAGGVAAFTTSSLTATTHYIKATYAGDPTFASSSGYVTQVVNGYTTSTTLVSSLNPSIYGQKVTWTSTVTTTDLSPATGIVNFTWGDSSAGARLNASGVATLTLSTLNADLYPFTAIYLGDANNEPSTSAILNQVITETTSTATLTSSPNPSTQGQSVTFTATINSPTTSPTGPVTFTAGKTVLGTAQLSGRKAIFTTSTLPVGSTPVTATYDGDSNIAESSASVTQTVEQ